MKILILIAGSILVFYNPFYAQDAGKYKIVSIGFYNLENLFDTVDDTLINDEEFLPKGARSWTPERYQEKLTNMAYVISQIGLLDVAAGLSVLGVSEIENRKVLEDLVIQPAIKNRNYQIVHYDSPDGRGVDVGLLYNASHFTVLSSTPIPLINYSEGEIQKTRDVLYVTGLLDTDTIHILVNHWPSRSGGEARTAPYRNSGAKLCRKIVDSLFVHNRESKILIMGDLNDDPTNESIKSHLRAVSDVKEIRKSGLFNPYEDFFRRGQGSNAYRDAWSLFDQIIVSRGFTNKKSSGFNYFKANIFNKRFLVQPSGQYKGYPWQIISIPH